MEPALAANDVALLHILAWSIALGLAQIVVSVLFNIASRGLIYGVGPRDDGAPVTGPVASRTERAHRNFLETFAFFAAAVLTVHALGAASSTTVLGGEIYLGSRIVYLPLYMAGVPWVRTLAWSTSVAGIVMVWMAAVGGL